MAKRWYGSLQNRLEENRQFVDEIKVGMGATEYYYTDREPYEVIAVKDQKHITVRKLDAKRIDSNGMSDCQEYEYVSNENNYTVDLVKRGDYWYIATTITAEELEDIMAKRDNYTDVDIQAIMWASQFDHDKVREKGKQTKYHKMNISIGRAEKYYDYSF